RRSLRKARGWCEIVEGQHALVGVPRLGPGVAILCSAPQIVMSIAAGRAIEIAEENHGRSRSDPVELDMNRPGGRNPGSGVGVEMRAGKHELAACQPITEPHPPARARTPIVRPRDTTRRCGRV